ncbi:MAG: NAD(P)H-hydrate dehydratase [Candidatus Omnitrophica bacterium]|nr:NAD(P)H-hydrate dehydratase [Candidatus Omnitrophota bacterium]
MENVIKKRLKDSHKGDYGHVFILAGSRGLTGAAALCANAALRSGAGLVTLGIPDSLNAVMQIKLTEAMTCPLPETKRATLSLKAENEILKRADGCDAVVLGPGLSRDPETIKLIKNLIPKIKKTMVLDADALNAIAGTADILKKAKVPVVITPHPGEMSGLIGKNKDFIQKNRLNVAKRFSNNYNAVVVLKGMGTIVADKNSCYINKTGNPGMATAGSGDVLSGIVGSFLAQGIKAFNAARMAVYVHGLAGDLAAKEKGEAGLIASDILDNIPEAIKSIIDNRADTRVAKGVRL